MPQLAPLSWLFFIVFLFLVLFVFSGLVWWVYKAPLGLKKASNSFVGEHVWSW